jgi:fumarate reductase flavoprotein subunit
MSRAYDVVVVGAGGAGMAAAIEAHDAGASVIVLEADGRIGGSTSLSGGVFYAAGTSVQHARGIEDSPDAMFEYYMTLNQWRVEPGIVRRLCDDADARVLDSGEHPIHGLYAAGETAGGVMGARYIGGGASIANAVVFGRIAGANAAVDASASS